MRMVARIAGLAGLLSLGACGPGPLLPETQARVEGALALPGTGAGDAWLFLYAPGEGPPSSQAVPLYATAVPEVRIAAGDGRYVFAGVAPGDYRLWGFLDADRDFHPELDVLAQPGAGDRPVSAAAGLSLEAGQHARVDLTLGPPYAHPPPAFRVDTAETLLELPDQPLGLVTLNLVADGLGVLDAARAGFAVSLVDADRDGQADDANGDGIPDLSPQLFLRFLPRPGQTVPVDGTGRRLEVIVPLLYNPAPFLLALNGELTRELVVDRLQAVVVPQAQALTPRPELPPLTSALGAIPVGDYELWAIARSGQFWRVPNALAGDSSRQVGGPIASQALQLRFVHGTAVGAPRRAP